MRQMLNVRLVLIPVWFDGVVDLVATPEIEYLAAGLAM